MPPRKRKRSTSALSSSSPPTTTTHRSRPLSSDTINPLSHSQGTLKQLRAAGLTDTDVLPSTYLPDFPHRPLRPARRRGQDRDDVPSAFEDDNDGGRDGLGAAAVEAAGRGDRADRARRARQMRGAQDQRLGVLTGVVLRALDEGDIPRARRAFGLLRRSEVRGKPADLRRNGLWSLGAEVLMREGETRTRCVLPGGRREEEGEEGEEVHEYGVLTSPPGDDDGQGPMGHGAYSPAGRGKTKRATARRWGSPANMPQLRAYLEGLIRQYPYNRLHPNSISSLDFHPVLFGCEFYNTWVEHKLALEHLDQASEAWSDDLDDMPDGRYLDDDGGGGGDHDLLRLTGRERRLRREKTALAQRSLAFFGS